MDFDLTPEQRELQNAAIEFAREEVKVTIAWTKAQIAVSTFVML